MLGHNLFLHDISKFCWCRPRFNIFIPDWFELVWTSFLQVFSIPVRGSWILKISRTGPDLGASKKGKKTRTGLDFKALHAIHTPYMPYTLHALYVLFPYIFHPIYTCTLLYIPSYRHPVPLASLY